MFQNRCPLLYDSSAFLLSILCIVWISFYPGTSSLEPCSLFYDLIASYYTKGKLQWRQGYLFCFESYHFDKKMFFYICYTSSPKQVTNASKIWIGDKVNLHLTQKWEENIPKLYFCIQCPTFSTRIPYPLKICFTIKVNAVCEGGQWLVTGSQGPITRVPGVRIPCLRTASLKAHGLSSRVSGSQVSGSQGLGNQSVESQGPGSQVSGSRIPGFRSWFYTMPS